MNKNNVVIICPLQLAAEFEQIKTLINNISGLPVVSEGQNIVRNVFSMTFLTKRREYTDVLHRMANAAFSCSGRLDRM